MAPASAGRPRLHARWVVVLFCACLDLAFVAPNCCLAASIDLVGRDGPTWRYYAPQAVVPETHVVGIYTADQHEWPGSMDVHVLPPTDGRPMVPMTLVLSARDPIIWRLDLRPGVVLTQIIVNGGELAVEGAGAVPVVERSGDHWLGAYAYAWPEIQGGSNTPKLVSAVEELTGVPITSFTGAYEAREVTLVGTAVPEPGMSWLFVSLAVVSLWRRRGAQHPQCR